MIIKKRNILIALLLFVASFAIAQEVGVEADNGWAVDVEMQGSFSSGKTPLWLNANKYGMSSLNSNNGYVRGIGEYDHKFCNDKLDIKAGLDLIVPIAYKSTGPDQNYTSYFFVQQAYAELDYKLGQLIIGAKHMPMELKNNELSSGSQTLGINARPVPQVRIGLNDYWNIPGTKRWVGIKGHIAYGVMTDGNWEESFASWSKHKYNKWTRYHQKAGYLRIGNEWVFPLTLALGLEMGGQFGGTLNTYNAGTGQYDEVTLKSNFKSYWNIFTGSTAADYGEEGSVYQNAEGNMLGSWVARLNWNAETWELGAYWDHFFEDHSGMFFLDYDGYGTGDQWNTKVENRYFRYDLKDMLIGVDLKLKMAKAVNQVVFEYINTRYKCGPIYHDHTVNIPTHISGRDYDYNHYCLSGWQHWGQVMGNPLYLSPVYNNDGYIGTWCNRFYGFHFGVAGDPIEGLHYRVKVSYQKGWGTYDNPFYEPLSDTSLLLEASYAFHETSPMKNFTITGAFGADFGYLRGNNQGAQITLRYKIK